MTLYDFYERYININLRDYINIGIDLEISKIIVIIALGTLATTLIIAYRRSCILTVINALLDSGATDEGSAKTLSELKIDTASSRMILLGRALRRAVTLKRESEGEKRKINFKQDRFYISREGLGEANRFISKTAPTFEKTTLFCVLICMICICIILIIPEILTSVNSILEL